MNTIFLVGSGIAGWIATSAINYRFYGWLFGRELDGMDRDLLVALGPVGSVMLLLCALLQGLLHLCASLGKRFSKASNFALVVAVILVPWLGASVANYVWYGRLFGRELDGMDRDLLVALGPVGSVMLILCALLQGLLKLSAVLGGRDN